MPGASVLFICPNSDKYRLSPGINFTEFSKGASCITIVPTGEAITYTATERVATKFTERKIRK